MFQCLVIRISLVTTCYFHSRARYIFLSHDSQAWPPGHVCGVRAGFSNIPGVPSADSLVSFYITVRRSGEMNGCAGSLQRRSILDQKLKEMSGLFSKLVTSIGVS